MDGLEQQLRRATARASDAAQPYNYLVERISTAENDAESASTRERTARDELNGAKTKLASAREEVGTTTLYLPSPSSTPSCHISVHVIYHVILHEYLSTYCLTPHSSCIPRYLRLMTSYDQAICST